MPTKLPAYMISGRPILVYGDKSIAQAKYALKDGWGLCVTNRSSQDLKKAINKLLLDADIINNLVENSYKTLIKNHNLLKVKLDFQNEFINVK